MIRNGRVRLLKIQHKPINVQKWDRKAVSNKGPKMIYHCSFTVIELRSTKKKKKKRRVKKLSTTGTRAMVRQHLKRFLVYRIHPVLRSSSVLAVKIFKFSKSSWMCSSSSFFGKDEEELYSVLFCLLKLSFYKVIRPVFLFYSNFHCFIFFVHSCTIFCLYSTHFLSASTTSFLFFFFWFHDFLTKTSCF